MNISQENILQNSIITQMDLKSSAASELKASLNGLMFDSIIENHMITQAAVKAPKVNALSTVNAADNNRSDIKTDLDNNRQNSDYGQVERNFEKPAASSSSKDQDTDYDKTSINTKGRTDAVSADTKGSSDVQQSDDAGTSEKNAVNNIEEIDSDNSQNADKAEKASFQAVTDEVVSEPLKDGLLVKILGSLEEDTIEASGKADDAIEISDQVEEFDHENNAAQNNNVEQSELILSDSNVIIDPDTVMSPDAPQETSELSSTDFDDAVYHVIKDIAVNECPAEEVQAGSEKIVIEKSTDEYIKAEAFKPVTPENAEIKIDGKNPEVTEHPVISEDEGITDAIASDKAGDKKEIAGEIDLSDDAAELVSKTSVNKNSIDDKKVIPETADENGPDASELSYKDNYKIVDSRYSEKNSLTNTLDIKEAGDDAASAVSRFMSGLVVNADRENGLKTGKGNVISQDRSVTGNTGAASGAPDSMVQANGATVQVRQTPALARPSAFNEIVDKIVYSVKGENNLGVTVKHEQLGNINIRLSLENGMVNVHINAQDRAAREMLETNMQELVKSLEENGVSVGGFSVALKNNGNNSGYQSGNNKGYSGGGHIKGESDMAPVQAHKSRGLVSILA